MQTIVLRSEEEVIESMTWHIQQLAQEAILGPRGRFRIGVSGGSMVNILANLLQNLKSDFSQWIVYFCDERYVPDNHPESTFSAYRLFVMQRTQLTEANFVKVNTTLPLEECAADYERRIREDFKTGPGEIPEFDLLMLGIGPDGHTCSLFPDHPLLNERTKLVATISNSPKPPPVRVTMTYPLINCSKCTIFPMLGSSKAEIVKRVFLQKDQRLPAAKVCAKGGNIMVYTDPAAGIHVKS